MKVVLHRVLPIKNKKGKNTIHKLRKKKVYFTPKQDILTKFYLFIHSFNKFIIKKKEKMDKKM